MRGSLVCDESWDNLRKVLSTNGDNVRITWQGTVVNSQQQEYVGLMCMLMRKFLSWWPKQVAERDCMCKRAHTLHPSLP